MSEDEKLIDRERRYTPWLTALFAVAALTGFVTLGLAHGTVQQAVVLSHAVTGICLSLIVPVYTWHHFRRSLGFRRAGLIASGLVIAVISVMLILSGWHMIVVGRLERAAWIYTSHWLAGIAVLAVLIVHLWSHVRFFPARRLVNGKPIWLTFGATRSRTSLLAVAAFLGIIPVIAVTGLATSVEYRDTPAVTDYPYPYGDHPFRPSQTETSTGTFVDPRWIQGSFDCGSCHTDIVRQWSASAHRKAASDPAYRHNVGLLVEQRGIVATRYCEGCHTPIALLGGYLAPGGRHGGIPGNAAHEEGISCLSCHSIQRVVHLKGVASYEFTPMTPYLFHASSNPLLARINRFLIKVAPQQHKADLGGPLLKDPQFCATCHTQFMDKDVNLWGWVKMQDEYSAWLNSPYSGQQEQRFAGQQVVRCQDCHMELAPGVDPSANVSRQIRTHRFPGANTMLALADRDPEHLALTKRFLQANRMRISIESPHRSDAQQTLAPMTEEIRERYETPVYVYLGERLTLNVVVSNIGVGHDFPGGTIDLNEAWIEVRVTDAEGSEVFMSGGVSSEGYVDPTARFYRALPINRGGRQVWTHELYDMVGEAGRNVVQAGKSDIVTYTIAVPGWVKNPLSVSATLKYRKLNQRYRNWALKPYAFDIPVVDVARDFLTIPVRLQKPAEVTVGKVELDH